MPIPTQTQWNALKTNAGIAKSAWWKPADAAVGPALKKVESAKAAYKGATDPHKKYEAAGSYMGALYSLHQAFEKFLKKKDLSAAGPLKTSIEGWMDEVATKHTNLKAKIPKLKADDAKNLQDIMKDI